MRVCLKFCSEPQKLDKKLLGFIMYSVDYPVGEQSKEEVRVTVVILGVVNGSEVEVGLALAIAIRWIRQISF